MNRSPTKTRKTAPERPADAVMALAAAAMLEQLKESRWYSTAPQQARVSDPVIEITGVEYRNVCVTVGGGLGGVSSGRKPFLVGRVEVGGIPAKLALRLDFGIGGFVVEEGEG